MIDEKQVVAALRAASGALETAIDALEHCVDGEDSPANTDCTCGFCEAWFASESVNFTLVMLDRERHSIHNVDKCAYCGAYSSLGKPK